MSVYKTMCLSMCKCVVAKDRPNWLQLLIGLYQAKTFILAMIFETGSQKHSAGLKLRVLS